MDSQNNTPYNKFSKEQLEPQSLQQIFQRIDGNNTPYNKYTNG